MHSRQLNAVLLAVEHLCCCKSVRESYIADGREGSIRQLRTNNLLRGSKQVNNSKLIKRYFKLII